MSEILNREEIDALLAAISTGQARTSESCEPAVRKVRTWDFRRPDKFSGEHIRTLQMIHETFSRVTASMLSARLRVPVSIHVASVDQFLYEDFIRSIPSPTTLAVMDVPPLEGAFVIEIGPGLTFTIIDRLFGGHGESPDLNRELTDIELYTMDRLFAGIAGSLMVTWSNIIPVRPLLACIETDPQFAQIVPPKDIVMLITFEAKIGDAEGVINLCMPYISLEPVIEKLSVKYLYSSGGSGKSGPAADRLDRTEYMRHIIFTDAFDPLSPEAIRRLKPGTLIPLKKGTGPIPRYEFVRAGREV